MQAAAADVPDGFSITQVATGMTSLTRMELLPDGRILVCEQGGNIRVIENGVLRSTPFLTVDADSFSEHGLLGITLDPAFETNHSSTFTTLQKLLLCTTAWGVGELGPLVYFATSGVHTLRIQPREDGLSLDQVVLSPQAYLNTAPGALLNDTTIVAKP